MDPVLGVALGCLVLAVAATTWCAVATVPLAARVAQLELERPRFIAELEGMLDACNESLARADAKRKRADNALRAVEVTREEQPPPMHFRRGTVIESLP